MPTVFIFDHVTQKSVDQSARKLEQDVQASIAEVELELDTCLKKTPEGGVQIVGAVEIVGAGGLETNRLKVYNGSDIYVDSNLFVANNRRITCPVWASNASATLKITDAAETNELGIDLSDNTYSELSYNSIPLFRINSDNNTVRAIGSGGLATNRLVAHTGSSIDIDSNVIINGTLSHKHSTSISDSAGIVVTKAYSIYIRKTGNSNQTTYTLPTSGSAYDELRGSTIMIKNCVNVDVPTRVFALGGKLEGGGITYLYLTDLSSVILYCSDQDEYWYILSSHGLINYAS